MLKQKQVELEPLEVKLVQKSIAENNMAKRQCVSITISMCLSPGFKQVLKTVYGTT